MREDWKCGGLCYMVQHWKEMRLMRPFGRVPSEVPRTPKKVAPVLLDAYNKEGTKTNEGQGAKTGAEEPNNGLQLRHWRMNK